VRPLRLTAVLVVALVAGCGGAPERAAPVAAEAPATATPAPVATTPPPPAPTGPANPLTGTRPAPSAPLVAVKVDNSPFARPYHRGLDRAAVVYQELMEGGATRFLALFDGSDAGEVGPVRSVRENDLELLRPFGKVAVGFSGGNDGVKRTFAAAVRAGTVLDASYDASPGSYRLGEQRRDARNFFTTPARLAALRPGSAKPRDVGLRFGPLAAGTGTPTASARARFSDISRVDLAYDAASGRWALAQDGTRMARVAAANVVVQRVRVRSSRYVDVNGMRSPYSVTTGSGEVTVLRDGVRVSGTWKRTAAGTRLLDAKGRDIPLRAGATWVLLLPTGEPLTFG
jgi:hypothetical protein